jgi:hypothetical protein
MRRETEVAAVADIIKEQLKFAVEEKSVAMANDAELDLLILSLLDKLETLLWVLELADMEDEISSLPRH